MGTVEDLTGKKFGKLTVLEKCKYKSKDGRIQWVCRCDCGKIKIVRAKHLKNGSVISCGCYFKNNVKNFCKKSYDTHSSAYSVWCKMKTYKARCKEWDNYEVFLKWLCDNNYNNKIHNIMRKDRTKEYTPDNTIIVNKDDSFKNELNPNSILYEIDGTYKSIRGWCKEYNVKERLVYNRLNNKYNLPLEICLLPSQLYKKAKKEYLYNKKRKDYYNPKFNQNFTCENGLSGIYEIKNIINDKIYIGSSSNIGLRWKEHLYQLKNNKHHSLYLQNSWNKYGAGNFIFKVIEYCSEDKLIEKEQEYIDNLHSYTAAYGYNMCKIAGSPLGHKHSEESKLKMRKNSKSKKKLYQYDIDMNLIKVWDSIAQAHRECGYCISAIGEVLRGKAKTYKNFIWSH